MFEALSYLSISALGLHWENAFWYLYNKMQCVRNFLITLPEWNLFRQERLLMNGACNFDDGRF
jgi:hypothetical protein